MQLMKVFNPQNTWFSINLLRVHWSFILSLFGNRFDTCYTSSYTPNHAEDNPQQWGYRHFTAFPTQRFMQLIDNMNFPVCDAFASISMWLSNSPHCQAGASSSRSWGGGRSCGCLGVDPKEQPRASPQPSRSQRSQFLQQIQRHWGHLSCRTLV